MTTSSPTPLEKSRKAHSLLLSALQKEIKQSAIAAEMDVSPSAITGAMKEAERVFAIIYLTGYKVVNDTDRIVDGLTLDAMAHITGKVMSNPTIARQVMCGEAE